MQGHTKTGTRSLAAITSMLQHAGESSARLQTPPMPSMHTVVVKHGEHGEFLVYACMYGSDRRASHIVCHGDCGTLNGADGV